MRRFSLILIIILSFQSCEKEKSNSETEKIYSDKNVTVENSADNEKITITTKEDIQKYYAEFQNELNKKALDSVSFTYECDGREGTVTYFSKDSVLKIIKNEYAEYSHYSAVEKYFLNEEKPFFIFKDETVWHFDGGTPEKPETKDDVTESRMYLINGKPVECLVKKYSIRSVEKTKPNASKIPNLKSNDCKTAELLSEFEKLLKHKDHKTDLLQCL